MIVYNSLSALTKVYLGNEEFSKVYSGEHLVFPAESPVEPIYRWIQTDITTCEYEEDPESDYSGEYLTLVALESGQLGWEPFDNVTYIDKVEYSKNEDSWTEASARVSLSTHAGDKIKVRAKQPNRLHFTGTGRFSVEGNPLSMIFGSDFTGQTTSSSGEVASLFSNNADLVSAKNLYVPSTMFCSNMFENCTSLVETPSLTSTTLSQGCYTAMFKGCTSLTAAPQLPATTLANDCYYSMFSGCTSLTTAPALPATTLTNYCYSRMFQGCTGLTTTPQLPATTLASNCYSNMFNGCTSLQTAPALPATTLASSCYKEMFSGCTSLTTAPALPATTLASFCYQYMFQGCSSLQTAPELPATTLAASCYGTMFQGCSSLNYIKCLATDISADYCTFLWLSGVATTGTFVKNASMNDWTTGSSGVPNRWTIQDAA